MGGRYPARERDASFRPIRIPKRLEHGATLEFEAESDGRAVPAIPQGVYVCLTYA